MRQKLYSKVKFIGMAFVTVMSSVCMFCASITVSAKEMTENIVGNYYEFKKDSKYEISESEPSSQNISESAYGLFSISGNMKVIPNINGVVAYEVVDSNVQLTYKLNDKYKDADNNEWHLIEDKSKTVDGMKLEEDILSGALILQTSLTGDSWITDAVYTDIRGEESEYMENFYVSKDIQQVNGCYYRIIVTYELRKENQVEKSFTNWSGKEQEYKKCAEVYEFYLINSSENSSGVTLATDTPRKELGTKINTGKDNGYSGNEAIGNKDPHSGWKLGAFFVNGYTRETIDYAGNPVFLKNVGDRVTLWFNLQQDIDCLDGKENLSIHEDINGHDQYFEIGMTNFKRGALVIRYTDYEGKKHEPIIYTDYLAASARTGANTKVELFEEGDYEVALNYEIRDSSGVDSYTNYRIYFKFSIRNGNCMVYLFDTVTGAELADNAITDNGFRLDMAKSRYLTIDVKKEIVKANGEVYSTDERFNRPAKDGENYFDEGIYTYTVKNLYTDSEPTTKVVYVGTSPVLRAMASGHTLEEINEQLKQGAELQEDGTLVMPKVEETSLPATPEPETAIIIEQEENTTVEENAGTIATAEPENAEVIDAVNTTTEGTANKTSSWIVYGAVIVVIVVGLCIALSKKLLKRTNIPDNISEEADKE